MLEKQTREEIIARPDTRNPSMHWLITAYTVVAIWMGGWLTATFGWVPALLTMVILGLPAIVAWRMITAKVPSRRHEYGYVSVITIVAVAATTFLVMDWYAKGIDKLVMFDREYQAFLSDVSTVPEFKNVEVSFTHRKGARVYLEGTVGSKFSHDRLIQTVESRVRYNRGGYYDGVEYPGKPKMD